MTLNEIRNTESMKLLKQFRQIADELISRNPDKMKDTAEFLASVISWAWGAQDKKMEMENAEDKEIEKELKKKGLTTAGQSTRRKKSQKKKSKAKTQ